VDWARRARAWQPRNLLQPALHAGVDRLALALGGLGAEQCLDRDAEYAPGWGATWPAGTRMNLPTAFSEKPDGKNPARGAGAAELT